ncbi:hypothetical protein [Streptomyces sp. NBC_00996]|uniref:hypothetical protein n=1 Tax=Streptomyces sp. NBC_00996 TaxID=2903710 RepID=UPI00386C2C2B|nr:hypothetical protein OG390_41045 [Streptomyces sp. NBC_00996]
MPVTFDSQPIRELADHWMRVGDTFFETYASTTEAVRNIPWSGIASDAAREAYASSQNAGAGAPGGGVAHKLLDAAITAWRISEALQEYANQIDRTIEEINRAEALAGLAALFGLALSFLLPALGALLATLLGVVSRVISFIVSAVGRIISAMGSFAPVGNFAANAVLGAATTLGTDVFAQALASWATHSDFEIDWKSEGINVGLGAAVGGWMGGDWRSGRTPDGNPATIDGSGQNVNVPKSTWDTQNSTPHTVSTLPTDGVNTPPPLRNNLSQTVSLGPGSSRIETPKTITKFVNGTPETSTPEPGGIRPGGNGQVTVNANSSSFPGGGRRLGGEPSGIRPNSDPRSGAADSAGGLSGPVPGSARVGPGYDRSATVNDLPSASRLDAGAGVPKAGPFPGKGQRLGGEPSGIRPNSDPRSGAADSAGGLSGPVPGSARVGPGYDRSATVNDLPSASRLDAGAGVPKAGPFPGKGQRLGGEPSGIRPNSDPRSGAADSAGGLSGPVPGSARVGPGYDRSATVNDLPSASRLDAGAGVPKAGPFPGKGQRLGGEPSGIRPNSDPRSGAADSAGGLSGPVPGSARVGPGYDRPATMNDLPSVGSNRPEAGAGMPKAGPFPGKGQRLGGEPNGIRPNSDPRSGTTNTAGRSGSGKRWYIRNDNPVTTFKPESGSGGASDGAGPSRGAGTTMNKGGNGSATEVEHSAPTTAKPEDPHDAGGSATTSVSQRPGDTDVPPSEVPALTAEQAGSTAHTPNSQARPGQGEPRPDSDVSNTTPSTANGRPVPEGGGVRAVRNGHPDSGVRQGTGMGGSRPVQAGGPGEAVRPGSHGGRPDSRTPDINTNTSAGPNGDGHFVEHGSSGGPVQPRPIRTGPGHGRPATANDLRPESGSGGGTAGPGPSKDTGTRMDHDGNGSATEVEHSAPTTAKPGDPRDAGGPGTTSEVSGLVPEQRGNTFAQYGRDHGMSDAEATHWGQQRTDAHRSGDPAEPARVNERFRERIDEIRSTQIIDAMGHRPAGPEPRPDGSTSVGTERVETAVGHSAPASDRPQDPRRDPDAAHTVRTDPDAAAHSLGALVPDDPRPPSAEVKTEAGATAAPDKGKSKATDSQAETEPQPGPVRAVEWRDEAETDQAYMDAQIAVYKAQDALEAARTAHAAGVESSAHAGGSAVATASARLADAVGRVREIEQRVLADRQSGRAAGSRVGVTHPRSEQSRSQRRIGTDLAHMLNVDLQPDPNSEPAQTHGDTTAQTSPAGPSRHSTDTGQSHEDGRDGTETAQVLFVAVVRTDTAMLNGLTKALSDARNAEHPNQEHIRRLETAIAQWTPQTHADGQVEHGTAGPDSGGAEPEVVSASRGGVTVTPSASASAVRRMPDGARGETSRTVRRNKATASSDRDVTLRMLDRMGRRGLRCSWRATRETSTSRASRYVALRRSPRTWRCPCCRTAASPSRATPGPAKSLNGTRTR